jgi:Tfp pilus assembly protein PilN
LCPLHEELQGIGYAGSYDTVKRFIRTLRKEALTQATVRYETTLGRQIKPGEVHISIKRTRACYFSVQKL